MSQESLLGEKTIPGAESPKDHIPGSLTVGCKAALPLVALRHSPASMTITSIRSYGVTYNTGFHA